MAVVDKYTDSNISGNIVNKLLKTLNAGGADPGILFATFEVAAADDDDSVYRVFKSVDPNLIPLFIMVGNDAIADGTDYGLGLYEPDLGAVIDKDAFAADLDMSVAAASMNPVTAKDGMAAVDIDSYNKRIYEHAGHTVATRLEAYDIAFTADTVGTGAGTISVAIIYVQG